MHADDDLLPISALQHLTYCPRQCALIHVEQVWSENLFTAEGRVMHDKAHDGGTESRGDVRTATGVRLVSHKLGLTGQADMVEFHKAEEEKDNSGQKIAVKLPGAKGLWKPFPIEYKRGKSKTHQADEVQLCAQAMCLEEMLKVTIPVGALFYGATRRRQEVAFTLSLRELTETTTIKLHELMSKGITPPPNYDKGKCDRCSLLEICRPQALDKRSAEAYLKRMLVTLQKET
ncbi:CRISPR-associated protein Cas4 [candidate division TA06 bacterium]|uniref:CRISPR-associated exonuclease Cas4 n=1 Tax=candidate division TA06 bacterium TaxID=2250710 RepID=A0A933ML96_UNCT6|nr:CRISPR-associated protein Cas4 [candidate division TA06 bacterium]